jgi:Metal-dependent hydrolase
MKRAWGLLIGWVLLASQSGLPAAETFRIATYNIENYLDRATESRPNLKSAASRAKVCESIRAAKPDVLAVQEIGNTNALLELQAALRREGVDLPYWEHVAGFDTNIFVAVLSRFPIVARRPHTNETFLLSGRRFRVSRGFAEVDIKVAPNYSVTLITCHLKSKRPSGYGDEGEQRLEEARILRRIVDANLSKNPNVNLIVLGDLNDTKDSPPVKTVIGRGRTKLVDTRPAERNGDDIPAIAPSTEPRRVTWTHYYAAEDSYSRIDFMLLSPGLSREWVKEDSWIVTVPNWGRGSDHRPIVATFLIGDR